MAEVGIQLPSDAAANKNLLRALTMLIQGSTVLQQVVTLGDEDGDLARFNNRKLAVEESDTLLVLQEISTKLDVIAEKLR